MKKLHLFGMLSIGLIGIWFCSVSVSADWVKHQGSWYYLNEISGQKETGWKKLQNHWYYLSKNGEMKTGWVLHQDFWYYFDQSGKMLTGWLHSNSNWYYLTESGSMQTGWFLYHGTWYFFDETYGHMVTGWKQVGDHWYHFLEGNGAIETGWIVANHAWYYLRNDGSMLTGWYTNGTQWYLLDITYGHMTTGWSHDGFNDYYLGSNGVMQKGWVNTNHTWYFLGEGGMQRGWYKDGATWYYLNPNGGMAKGRTFVKEEDKTYYFDNSGVMQSGMITDGGNRYYYDYYKGLTTNAWVEGQYYATSDGRFAKGYTLVEDKTLYFGSDHKVVKNSKGFHEDRYIDENGELVVSSWVENGNNYVNEKGYKVKNKWVDKKYLDENGNYDPHHIHDLVEPFEDKVVDAQKYTKKVVYKKGSPLRRAAMLCSKCGKEGETCEGGILLKGTVLVTKDEGKPEVPVQPEEPVETTPEVPVAPDEPINPDKPEVPVEPEIPEQPVKPEEPVQPEKPLVFEEDTEFEVEVLLNDKVKYKTLKPKCHDNCCNEEHTHEFKEIMDTIHHPAVVEKQEVIVPAYWEDKLVYEYGPYEVCNKCGEDLSSMYDTRNERGQDLYYANLSKHNNKHIEEEGILPGQHTEYGYKNFMHSTFHEEETVIKEVVVKEAWDESVPTGKYKCSCEYVDSKEGENHTFEVITGEMIVPLKEVDGEGTVETQTITVIKGLRCKYCGFVFDIIKEEEEEIHEG